MANDTVDYVADQAKGALHYDMVNNWRQQYNETLLPLFTSNDQQEAGN